MMDAQSLNRVLEELPPSQAAEVREFAGRDVGVQLVYLFREVVALKEDIAALKRSRSMKDRITDFGTAGALIAYLLFDQRGSLPGIGDR